MSTADWEEVIGMRNDSESHVDNWFTETCPLLSQLGGETQGRKIIVMVKSYSLGQSLTARCSDIVL